MFRQLLEEAFEEFKQTVAPARPEISFPRPPGTMTPLPEPHRAEEMMPRAATARRPPVKEQLPVPGPRSRAQSGLRSQLASPASVRSAMRIMEVLGPPVALRDPLDRVYGR